MIATVGLFDATLRFAEDTDWFNRLRESRVRHEHVPRMTYPVRRHEGHMTAGRTVTEANALRVFKKRVDRRRADRSGAGHQCLPGQSREANDDVQR